MFFLDGTETTIIQSKMKHKKMCLEGDFSSSIENYEKQLQFHVAIVKSVKPLSVGMCACISARARPRLTNIDESGSFFLSTRAIFHTGRRDQTARTRQMRLLGTGGHTHKEIETY